MPAFNPACHRPSVNYVASFQVTILLHSTGSNAFLLFIVPLAYSWFYCLPIFPVTFLSHSCHLPSAGHVACAFISTCRQPSTYRALCHQSSMPPAFMQIVHACRLACHLHFNLLSFSLSCYQCANLQLTMAPALSPS